MTQKTKLNEKIVLLQKLMRKQQLDGLLVTYLPDQFYLTDFGFASAGEAVLLIHAKGAACFARSLYEQPLRAFAPYMNVWGEDADRLSAVAAYAKKLGLKHVGFEADKETYMAGKFFHAQGFVEVRGILSSLRVVKNKEELKRLRASNRLAYQTYEYIKPRIKTGMTETQVAAEMERYMRMNGASGTSFGTIVAFGENAANPHHVTGERKLKAEDAVLIDFGCLYQG